MSHFTVAVLTKNGTAEEIEAALEPFDENKETPRYMKYTKQELIDHARARDTDYRDSDMYQKWLADKKAYVLDMIERAGDRDLNWGHLGYLISEFPKRLKWSDEEYFEWAIKDYEPHEKDEEGNVYSEYNPNAKWDWWQIGGRWNGSLTLKEGAERILGEFSWGWSPEEAAEVANDPLAATSARVRDIDLEKNGTYAILTVDGEWIQRGQMGWFGLSDDQFSEDAWETKWREYMASVDQDLFLTVVDCHI